LFQIAEIAGFLLEILGPQDGLVLAGEEQQARGRCFSVAVRGNLEDQIGLAARALFRADQPHRAGVCRLKGGELDQQVLGERFCRRRSGNHGHSLDRSIPPFAQQEICGPPSMPILPSGPRRSSKAES
jgi:hypothetical protein